jgi:carboxylesterase type B
MNYRLGPLGFPQGHEAADKNALNLGLKDQLAALTWIQDNIGLFGGDKDKVGVFLRSFFNSNGAFPMYRSPSLGRAPALFH